MSEEINMHISRLQSSKVSPIIAKISINYLSTHINRAKDIDAFYNIDYEKYGKQIIRNSDISDDIKEEIRKKFTNNVTTNGNQNVNLRRPRADTTVVRIEPMLGAPRPYVPQQQSQDDSYIAALTKESSEKNDYITKGIAVRRNFRRNSTYVKRLPSQILLFA